MYKISVIIPVYDEALLINDAVHRLLSMNSDFLQEIIIVDGHIGISTIKALRKDLKSSKKIKCTGSKKNRGIQMNTGAKHATGDILLFLHVDTILTKNAFESISFMIDRHHPDAGAFKLSIDSPKPIYRLLETVISGRAEITKIPYGDQAIFLRRRVFKLLNGFSEYPIMEDIDLMQRTKKRGFKIMILKEHVTTSSRRWEQEGILYCTLRNWLIISLYAFGVHPKYLARHYK